jgi:hypothetical protein
MRLAAARNLTLPIAMVIALLVFLVILSAAPGPVAAV